MPTNTPVLKFVRLSLACLVLYWIVLATLTHWPFPASESEGPKIDKPLHQIAFALLTLGVCWAVGTRRRLTPAKFAMIAAVVLLYGAIDEITQDPIPRRSPSVADWLADAVGVAVGIAIWWFAPRGWKAFLGDRSSREISPPEKTSTPTSV